MFEPTFSLFRHFVYLDLSRNLVPRSSHSLRLSRHFEYISILVGNFGHVILLCARVFSRAAAILKSEKTLGTRLCLERAENLTETLATQVSYFRGWKEIGDVCTQAIRRLMPPTSDHRQRQRNMNPGSGQSKQESYVIMLIEIGFTRV